MAPNELNALRAAQEQLRREATQALDAGADLRDLLNATAHANKLLRQQAQRALRLATVSVLIALAAAAVAAAALLL